jgi:cytochrome c biogenesis protein CcdA/thiol-disulfide isomerase/thioredoxin
MILFLLSLLAGVLTVLAPCTISLLPVIVGGSLAGGSSIRRTLVVTGSLGVSVIVFTLLLKVSTAFINVPQSFWQIFSGVIIVGLGLTMIFPALWDRISFVGKINRDSNKLLATGYMKQSFLGDVLVGAALGPVFSSCSPTYFLIIATVLPRSVLAGSIYLLAYTVGMCGGLLVVAIAGQKLLDKLGVAADPNGWLKRGIGVLFLVVGLAIAFGLDARIELAFANSGVLNAAGIEQKFLTAAEPAQGLMPTGAATSTMPMPGDAGGAIPAENTDAVARIAAKALVYPRAPEITDPSGFVNTNGQPITFASLKGKVILVDFWDYSCINCEREIPYVEAWYQKYQADGLVVVGVHTPEFAFEKLLSNVQAAVKSLGITYPVVLDNDYSTWNAFDNQFWPQIYLIDSDGFIVYSHSGEGDYPQTEAQIQKALAERNMILNASTTVPMGTVAPANAVEADFSKVGSPETYFGSDRNQYLANGTQGEAGNQNLTLPTTAPTLNQLYLGGLWNFQGEYAETSDPSAKILYNFDAKNMYMVATSANGAKLKILLDGQPIGANGGVDVAPDGTVTVQANRLYSLVNLPDYGTHTLEIEVESGTLDAYTFTFG